MKVEILLEFFQPLIGGLITRAGVDGTRAPAARSANLPHQFAGRVVLFHHRVDRIPHRLIRPRCHSAAARVAGEDPRQSTEAITASWERSKNFWRCRLRNAHAPAEGGTDSVSVPSRSSQKSRGFVGRSKILLNLTGFPASSEQLLTRQCQTPLASFPSRGTHAM